MSGPPPLQQLREFLVSSFNEGELRVFLGDLYGPRLVRLLPAGGSFLHVCEEAVATLERQGYVDDGLFAALTRHLPAKRAQIEQIVAARRDCGASFEEDPRPTTTRDFYEGYMYAIIELATAARARRAVMLQEGSCECGVGLLGLPRSGGSLEVVARDSAVLLSAQDADVFARLREPYILRDRDKILLGDTLVEVDLSANHPVIRLQGGQYEQMVPLARSVRLGRAAPLRVPQDPRMSRRHAQIDALHGEFDCDVGPGRPAYLLVDLGSANGTWVRIRERHRFGHGDEFRAYDGTFRVEVTLRR